MPIRSKITSEQKVLIEKLGVLYEKHKMQPAAARILSLLLVSDDPQLTFDDIRLALNLSKSATSNALTMLQNAGQIDYITKTGDRRRYFRNNIIQWESQMKQSIAGFGYFAEIMRQVLKQRPGDTVEFNTKMKEVINFIEFLGTEMKEVYKKWEKKKK